MAYAINESTLRERLIDFAIFLRSKRYNCSVDTILDVATVSSSGSMSSAVHLKRACKPCVCQTPDQWQRFDNLFDLYWCALDRVGDELGDTVNGLAGSTATVTQNCLVGFSAASSDKEAANSETGAGDLKTLSLADFRFVFDRNQMQLIEQLVDSLVRQIKKQRRRHTRSSNKCGTIDMRRSLRSALQHQGWVALLAYKQPVKRLPSMVLLLDVSQSMEVYSKLFLRFARQLMTEFDQAHAFAFNTSLFEIGKGHRQLKEADFEQIMNNHGKGWLGGTQIAGSFEQFNAMHLQRLVSSKTTVMIFSDGHDTAKPEMLLPQVQKLHRRAKKVIWVNPLLGREPEGTPDPKMTHVLPWITAYCSGHNLHALRLLQQHLIR
ncbi:MAG: VWA domain-containing protein [Granulosicoccaceae bacterium]